MAKIQEIIEQMIIEKLEVSDKFKNLTFKKVDEDIIDSPGEDMHGEKYIHYIVKNSYDKEVGKIKYFTYLGDYSGTLYNKDFKFQGRGDDVASNVKSWLKSKTFAKWSANLK